MKNLFNRDNFLYSTFDKKQKRQSLVVTILLIVMFLFAAFTFVNMLYPFADIIGSIVSGSMDVALKDLVRALPLFLTFFMSLWSLLLFHASFRNVTVEDRNKVIFKNGIVITCFAVVNILYVLINRFTGIYLSLIEGSPSPIFPLDSILYSLLFVAIGVFAILYGKKLHEKWPYEVPSRGPIEVKCRPLYCVGLTLWLLISLFGASEFFIGLFIIDFLHGYLFYSICLLLIYLLSPLLLLVWEFYYNELKPEKRKEMMLPMSEIAMVASVLLVGLYFVSLSFNLDGPSNIGFGVLPVAFAASVNIATMIVVVTPLIVSIVCFVKGIRYRKFSK